MNTFMGGCHQSARSSTLFCDVFNATVSLLTVALSVDSLL